jgi:hypothetical protein
MPDPQYVTSNLILESKGITARYADDAAPFATFLAMTNCEELAENAIGSRLGTTIVNKVATTPHPLASLVHSLAKLSGLNGTAWRYAGSSINLYRIAGTSPGAYTNIASTLSGNPWQAVAYAPEISNVPTLFIADANGMLKDTGLLPAPQQWGIRQPQYPVLAQAQVPDLILLDNYTHPSTDYVYTGIAGGTVSVNVNTTLTTAVTAPGIQAVSVANPNQIGLFQYLSIGAEQVLVLFLTPTGFVADFTATHTTGSTLSNQQLQVTVPASTTATVALSFGGTPISAWPTTLQQADYISLQLFVSDPSQITSITLKFDCGDGSFNTDYFYKVIGQGPQQSLLDTTNQPTTAAADAIISDSLGLYGATDGGIFPLLSGLNKWTPILLQLSDFAGSGRADFNDPVFNWENVNGYQIEVVTSDQASVNVGLSALVIFGGAGPDSFAGVAYDYLFTFYNNVDGTESNPCMVMTNLNPPNDTNWVLPRRQPVLLTMTYPTLDSQVTSLRIYRRGGTLGDNYRRIDEVLITGSPQQYTDIAADDEIEAADFVSFENDVPVTSGLPNPVNTVLSAPITTTNQVATVTPASMANISVGQQITLGPLTSTALINNTETVIVLTKGGSSFTAFVQNTHLAGEQVTATAAYAVPVTIIAEAYDQMWFAGDPNNPNLLYWSAKSNPQAVSSAANIPVSTPDDAITAIVQFKGNLYVSTTKAWWAIAPGTNANASPTVYPTACKHGCIAPLGFIATEEAIYYQAFDGIRAFAGGASMYLTQEQEFIFQDVGSTPIVEADPNNLYQTRMVFWNSMIFISYIGVDAVRHRLIFHMIYKRWRNDDVNAGSLLLESDTNTLVWGAGPGIANSGLVHIDRVGSYDETDVFGSVEQGPIPCSLQTPYKDQGAPANQKNYQEFTLDANTNGATVTVTLLFNDADGENFFSEVLGTITTAGRERFNLNLNNGDGYQAYKVSALFTWSSTERVYLYQAALRSTVLAKTRKSIDSYFRNYSTDESKLLKNRYFDYTSTAPINFTVNYDDPAWPDFSFTLPSSGGVRSVMRARMPAVKFRLDRIVGTSTADFMIWSESAVDMKPICQGKGYQKLPMLNPEM